MEKEAKDPFVAGDILTDQSECMVLDRKSFGLHPHTGEVVVTYYGYKCNKKGKPTAKRKRITFVGQRLRREDRGTQA